MKPRGAVWFSTDLLDTKPNDTHTIWHKVTDEFGVESEPVNLDLTIVPTAPIYEVSGPGDIFERTPTYWEFSAVSSRFRPIKDWEIDWGDGSEPTLIFGGPRCRIAVSHIYQNAGTCSITVKTTDFDGRITMVAIGDYMVKERVNEPFFSDNPVAAPMGPELGLQESMVFFTVLMQFTETNRFSFESYLSYHAETMRLRQMLDLDQSNQESDNVAYTDLVWKEDELFDLKWTGIAEEPKEADFWNEISEYDLLT